VTTDFLVSHPARPLLEASPRGYSTAGATGDTPVDFPSARLGRQIRLWCLVRSFSFFDGALSRFFLLPKTRLMFQSIADSLKQNGRLHLSGFERELP